MDLPVPVAGNLLDILCCPVSKTPLVVLSRQQLEKLNTAIETGDVLYVNGEKIAASLSEALITKDGKVIYPIEEDIPLLLQEKGIGTGQFQDLW